MVKINGESSLRTDAIQNIAFFSWLFALFNINFESSENLVVSVRSSNNAK